MKTFVRALKVVSTVLAVVVLAAGGGIGYVVRSPMPQTAGTLQVTGLQNQVDVYRDEWGVPHIYAESTHDLLFAQGYIHAQDRFWQMEFWRRIGSGRLSEVFGDATLATDRFTRTLGWARVAAEEEKLMDEETRFALQSYADGVNAYLDTHDNLGLEFTLLGAQGVNYKPEPWTIVNTLTWAKAMAWDLGGNMDSELERALLIQQLGVDRMLELKPLYPGYRPVIVPNPAVGFDASKTLATARGLSALLGGGFRNVGSNNWTISGRLTDTGKPYLANDPHLGIQMPSIWYEVGLHCRALSDVCPYDVTGFSFAGAPGVIIGHNNRIAWGVTNLGPDVQDLFIEKLNPDNANQYEVNGAWVDAQVLTEAITVRGKIDPDPEKPDADLGIYNEAAGTTTLAIVVRLTRHGPIINDINETAAGLSGEFGGTTLPTPSAIALRWTALDPSLTFQSVLKIDKAQNWDEFRNALRDWDVPSQNFVYADVDGNIGYQTPSKIPIRASGDGLLPVPGWTDEHEWTGFIPFDELPYSYNPPQGYIATANNAVVGPDYPYLISLEWDHGYRAQRIVDMIEAKAGAPITVADIQAIQGDNINLSAQEIMPFLAALSFEDAKLQSGLDYLKSWDFQQHMDSGPAALYNLFWVRLVSGAFYDELPEELWPGPGDTAMVAVRNLLDQPDNRWWDDVTTADKVETRDDILRLAFAEAYDEAESRMGTDTANWAWGKLHIATFRNATLGRSGISLVESIFNRGPVATSGGTDAVNATGWRISKPSDTRRQAKTFAVTSVPSMRMIVDFSNFGNSLTMHTTGQSGHPFNSHYDDMIDSWRLIQYHPMLWDRAAVEAASRGHLVLRP
jgi:penicillin amidase